jgi:four helix bundle protein
MPGTWRTLNVWRLADELFFEVHQLTKAFPKDERFVLTAQVRSAALSVPTNIVEGSARFNPRERVQLLRTAWASLAEVEYLVSVCERLAYIPSSRSPALAELIARTGGALAAYIQGIDPTTGPRKPRQQERY